MRTASHIVGQRLAEGESLRTLGLSVDGVPTNRPQPTFLRRPPQRLPAYVATQEHGGQDHLVRVLLSALVTLLFLAVSPAAAAPDEPVGGWPLEPEPDVVRGFEPPPSPYAAGHRGVDLAGTPGQAVRSSLPGTVGFAGSIGGKPVVTVLHGGRRTTYEPVAASVSAGQEVAAGEVLGRLTVTDSHCFPAACLHWGLIEGSGEDEAYADPLSLVGGGPVRLLPLWRDEPATHRPPSVPGWTPPLDRWPRPVDWLV